MAATGNTPDGDDALTLANDWVQALVRQRLLDTGVAPSDLATACGSGSEVTWRAKLNGGRSFRLADLLAINFAVDPDLFRGLPFGADDLRKFFPPEHRGRLSHTRVGAGIPTLRGPVVDWSRVATSLADWLRAERESGRMRWVTSDVVAHELLALVDSQGLPSMSATLSARTDTWVEMSWIIHDVHLRVAVPWAPREGEPDSTAGRAILGSLGGSIDAMAQQQARSKMLVSVLPPPMASASAAALPALVDTASREWFTIGPSEFHSLYASLEGTTPPVDCHARVIASALTDGLIWLEVK